MQSHRPISILAASSPLTLSASPIGSGNFGLPLAAGLPCAKKRILIAIARPAWRTKTTTSRMRDVLASVAETTG